MRNERVRQGGYLMHYGRGHKDGGHSGRYPWGSGDNPYQRNQDFLARIETLKAQGKSEVEIAKELKFNSTTEYRTYKSAAYHENRAADVARVKELQAKGLNVSQIGREMGKNESSIRSLLKEHSEERMNQAKNTAEFLKEQIKEKGMIDVGKGVEKDLGITKTKLDEALYLLEREGYEVYGGGIPQMTNPGKQTSQLVLCPPGTKWNEIYDYNKVHSLEDYTSHDDGETFVKAFQYPASLDSKRLAIRYRDDGGLEKDGVVEIRRGVKDLSLGESNYAQVRILVDGKYYIKGMAIYADDKDLPPGKDILFNSNKPAGSPLSKVLKPIDENIKKDPTNPFGSAIKEKGGQSEYLGDDGKMHLSLINKRADQGDWTKWDDTLASQFLSKQSLDLARKQINLSIADKQAEFDEIKNLTNPVVQRKLLESFASDCDGTAVSLKAAALPRQKWHVILPVGSLKDDEIYAPQYEQGEKVALIRYPHGGTFEIPILTVNKKNAEGRRIIGGNSIDAVGINSKVAERLSGADFDGDTVMVIPTHDKNGRVKITSTHPLKGLEGFDPKVEYPYKEGCKIMSEKYKQKQMGIVTNLITDMTLMGAPPEEIAAATRHSMVVIDAAKHKLDYKQSEKDNHIAELRERYQSHIGEDGKVHFGAATIISRAKNEKSVPETKGGADREELKKTGKLVYKESGRTRKYTKKDGTVVEEPKMKKSTQMAETDDAMTLVSPGRYPMELLYAHYANTLKAMANAARKMSANLKMPAMNPSAKKTYASEIADLNEQLKKALQNAPREREAQRRANYRLKLILQDNPDLDKSEVKKIRQREMVKARQEVGAARNPISISKRQWEAIQAGGISASVLSEILRFADEATVRQYATPRATQELSVAKIAKIKNMNNSNYDIRQIADAVGCSPATVYKYLEENKANAS